MLRRRRIVVAAVAGLALASSGIGASAADFPPRQSETYRTKVATPVRLVTIDNDSGSVRIRPSSRTEVTIFEQYVFVPPEVDVKVVKDVLTIVATCPDNLLLNNCTVDIDVLAPASVANDVDLGAGSIDVADITGDQKLRTSAGSVTGRALGSTSAIIEAKTSSGQVELEGIKAKKIDASTSSGSVDLDVISIGESIVATTSSGSVDVAVPTGAYNITTYTRSGAQKVAVTGIRHDPKSLKSISATTQSGSTTVHSRDQKGEH